MILQMDIPENTQTLEEFLVEASPTLIMFPKLELLVNKEEPILEDVLEICSNDKGLFHKLTGRRASRTNQEDFARDVLFIKGLSFLKSLAIRTLNHEVYELPLGLNGMSNSQLRRRSILLARFVKRFADDLRIEPDHLYIAGLLYNLPYVSYEYLIKTEKFTEDSFSEVRPETVKMTCEILEKFGFGSYIMHILEDSVLDIQQTRNPCEQALLRIANNILESTEQNNFIVGKNTSIDEKMLEITGYSEQEILILLKELSRNYKGTPDGWSE